MLPTFFPARRRVRRKRRVVVAPIAPLVVTGVVYVNDLGTFLEVQLGVNTTEAQPLLDASGASPAKWSARMNDKLFTGISVTTDGFDRLLLFLEQTGEEAGEDEISYAAPSDIEDSLGRELETFEDLPL